MSTYVFRTAANAPFIDRQRDQYRQILSQCWMANSVFACVCQDFDALEKRNEHKNTQDEDSRVRMNERIRRTLTHGNPQVLEQDRKSSFLIMVSSKEEIDEKVKQ